MKKLIIILSLCAGCISVSAQTTFTQRLQQTKQGEGKVTVTQDKAIDDLVNGPQTQPQRQTTEPKKTVTTQTPQTPQSNQQASGTQQQNKPDSSTVQRPQTTERPQQPDTTTVDDGTPRKKVMKGGYKVNGYRVQVYAGGNSRNARIKAEQVGREMNSLFPGTPVYVHFYSPRWICRMGNYRTYEEAHQVLNAVKKLGYSSAIIVKGKITVAYLSPSDAETP